MAQIKSKYFKVSKEQLESKLFYLNDVHTKFDKVGETTQFCTLNILDTNESVSLGGDIIRKDENDNISLRIKLSTQNDEDRIYHVYDSERKEVTTTISAEQVCELLKKENIVESDPLVYSKLAHLKTL